MTAPAGVVVAADRADHLPIRVCAECGALIDFDELIWVERCDGTCAESSLAELDIDSGIACVYHVRCITPPWRRNLHRGRSAVRS